MLTSTEIDFATVTSPPEHLTPETIADLVAARPEETLQERFAAAAYLDAVAAQYGVQWSSPRRANRLRAWAEARRIALATATAASPEGE